MAAKKADDAAVSPVQAEIAEILGNEMPEGDPHDQKFLKDVVVLVGNVDKVSADDWDSLSEAAQNWVGDAADALKAKKALPSFPGQQDEDETEDEPVEVKKEAKPKKKEKAAKKAAEEVEVEQEEAEDEQEETGVVASDESTSEDLDDESETQGKESEVATAKNKRGTKATKSAKAKEAKPQKRAAATETEAKTAKKAAGKAKSNGHARGASGVDTVFELALRNPKASVESVTEKAKAAGVKTSDTQIGTLYHLVHKAIDIGVKLGKFEA